MFKLRDYVRQLVSSLVAMYRLLWQSHRWLLCLLITVTFLSGVLPISIGWLNKTIFDTLQHNMGDSLEIPWTSLLFLTGFITISELATAAIFFLQNLLNKELLLKIKATILQKINSFSDLKFFDDPDSYDRLRLAEQGAVRGVGALFGTSTTFFQGFLIMSGFLGVLVANTPLLAVFIVLASIPRLALELVFGRKRFALANSLSPRERRLFHLNYLLTDPAPAKEIRLFGLGAYILKQYIYEAVAKNRIENRQEKLEFQWEASLTFASVLVGNGAIVFVIVQAFQMNLSFGDVTLFITALAGVQGALTTMVRSFANFDEGILFYSHFRNLSAQEPTTNQQANITFEPLRKGITLSGVSFRYTDQHPWILKNVNLFIPAHKCLALVGLNGAGKTTLIKLLTRLYDPTEGSIYWDDIKISHLDVHELRKQMSVIFQDFIRYDMTVEQNIGLGNINAYTHQEVQSAAEQTGIHQKISTLQAGYDTMLGLKFRGESDSQGVDLSGGEWQKIALSRMLMRKASILILDEPTSALDIRSEHSLFQQFKRLVQDKTSILITHRLSTVSMADTIAVLEEGKIIEEGTHAQLIKHNGVYAELYNMQATSFSS